VPHCCVRIAHHMPGRIRLKLEDSQIQRTDKAHGLEALKKSVGSMEGIRNIETNAASGSLIVHYDPHLYGRFEQHLQEHGDSTGDFHMSVPDIGEGRQDIKDVEKEADFLAEHSQTARVIVNSFRSLNHAVRLATDNMVDLQVLLPLGLAAVGFFEIGAAATPLGVTLGLFSFNSFISLHAARPGGPRSRRAIREAVAESQYETSMAASSHVIAVQSP
jgi:hypothetical protein